MIKNPDIIQRAFPYLTDNGKLVCQARQFQVFQKLKEVRPDIWDKVIQMAESSKKVANICVTIYRQTSLNGLLSTQICLDQDFADDTHFEIHTRCQDSIDIDLAFYYGNISIIIIP